MVVSNLASLVWAVAGGDGVDSFRDEAEAAVEQLDNLITPGERAVVRKQTSPPGQGVNITMKTMPLTAKLNLLPTVLGTMNTVSRSGALMKSSAPKRAEADESVWTSVEKVAKELGALGVGFVRVDDDEIFKQFKIPYRNAVVFTVGMDRTKSYLERAQLRRLNRGFRYLRLTRQGRQRAHRVSARRGLRRLPRFRYRWARRLRTRRGAGRFGRDWLSRNVDLTARGDASAHQRGFYGHGHSRAGAQPSCMGARGLRHVPEVRTKLSTGSHLYRWRSR